MEKIIKAGFAAPARGALETWPLTSSPFSLSSRARSATSSNNVPAVAAIREAHPGAEITW